MTRDHLGQGVTKRNAVAFACAAVGLSSVCVLALLFGVDLSLHKRFQNAAGLNVRGYRGPVLGRKRAGELRIVMLGGSTVFGYGVGPEATVPAVLERILNARRRQAGSGPVSVVNLGYNNEGAYSFPFTLRDYDRSLDYDVALLYQGYNELSDVPNTAVFRHGSAVFRLTGYLPILPLVAREKLMAMRYGGNLEAAYNAQKTAFTAHAANRADAQAGLRGAVIAQALKRQVGPLTREPWSVNREPIAEGRCEAPWEPFCASIAAALDYALARDVWVIVVTPPYLSDSHADQQRALVAMLRGPYGGESRLRYVDLGQGVVDLEDPAICFDGVHLTAEGNGRIAESLAQPVAEVLVAIERSRRAHPSREGGARW